MDVYGACGIFHRWIASLCIAELVVMAPVTLYTWKRQSAGRNKDAGRVASGLRRGKETAVSAIVVIKVPNSNNSYLQNPLHSRSTKTRMTLRKSASHELGLAKPELWQCPLLFCHESTRDNRSTVSKHT